MFGWNKPGWNKPGWNKPGSSKLDWNQRRDQLLNEFAEHIEQETLLNIERGMQPQQARHAAQLKFGNIPLALEQSREEFGLVQLQRILQDIRYSLRTLRRAPAYTATLVITLALGLGCATAMLAIVDSVLMEPVPLPHSAQLVELSSQEDVIGTHASPHALGYSTIDQISRNNRSFSSVAGYNSMVSPVSGDDGTRISVITAVTGTLFATLEVSPQAGRLIAPHDDKTPVAVINDEFWHDRLHAAPSVIGSSIRISSKPYTIIGILPRATHFPQAYTGPMVYVPASLDSSGADLFKLDSASTIARLKPRVSPLEARSDVQALVNHAASSEPRSDHAPAAEHIVLRSYRDVMVGDLRKPLMALFGGVGILLLIACANAANLQIGRAAGRLPEISVRSALGASFARLLQQLITESVLVALVSAALGGLLSCALIQILKHTYGQDFARFDELSVRPAVVAGSALLAVLVGVAASVAPAFNIRRKTSARANTRSSNTRSVTSSARIPGILVALQVALTCILLVAGGLFVRTLRQLQNVSLGFNPKGVTTLVIVPDDPNGTVAHTRAIETRLLRRMESLPGVQSVTMQSDIPFSNFNVDMDGTTDISSRAYQKGDSAHYSFVSTGFVQTSGIRLLAGRAFQAPDETSAAIVVLVNQAFVQKYLAGGNAVGATLKFHREPKDTDADVPIAQPMTVVGVVENEVQGGDLGRPLEPMVYVDYLQLPANSMLAGVFNMAAEYAIRSKLPTSSIAPELRSALKNEAPSMVEMELRSMSDSITDSLSQRRLALSLVSGFGFVALALSAIGMYGVLAYSVALRRREIGIRMALGSSRPGVARLVLRQAAVMVVLGLIPGLLGAWAAGHAISSFLFGVSPLDPGTLAAVAAILLVAALAAASIPTLRAAQVNPVETLRAE
jgi:predicted permease